jgi:hypothetical protein
LARSGLRGEVSSTIVADRNVGEVLEERRG